MREDSQDEDRRGEWAWVGCLVVIGAMLATVAGVVALMKSLPQ